MKLAIPIQAWIVNHSHNKNGDIQYTCDLFLNIKELIQKITLHVMTYGKENVILGLPWLKKANPFVDWTTQTLAFNKSIDKLQELYHTTPQILPDTHPTTDLHPGYLIMSM